MNQINKAGKLLMKKKFGIWLTSKNISFTRLLHQFCILSLLVISISFLSSCASYKKINYLQEAEGTNVDSLFQSKKYEYHLLSGDILHIQVNSYDEDITSLFNQQNNDRLTTGLGQGIFYVTGYSVSDSGYIDLPVIGKLFVMGLTVEKAEQLVSQQAATYLKDVRISLKLVSFRVNVLGEVKSPGNKIFYQNSVTVFDAIGSSGDVTYYGNRKNVKVVRHTNEGIYTFKIDLTDKNLLASEGYYLAPNDIVYIPPVRTAVFRVQISDYATFLTAVTSTLTAVLLVLNLNK